MSYLLTLALAVALASGWALIVGAVLTCPPNRARDSKSRPLPRGKDLPG